MKIILLERVEKLGVLGDEVDVKNGFARNYLIPQGKALRANAANRARFQAERDAIVARNEAAKTEAAESGKDLDGTTFTLIRQSGETGVLYGSVSQRDVTEAAAERDFKIARSQVRLNQPIKQIGVYDVDIKLHADVSVTVKVNIARTEDEAERQANGEDVIAAAQAENLEAAEEQAGEMAEAAGELQETLREAPEED